MAFDANRSALTGNIGLKIISLFIAVMLWLYVITITNPTVIREKSIYPKIKGLNERLVIVNEIKPVKVVYEGRRKEVINISDKIYSFIDLSGRVDAQRYSAPVKVFKPDELEIISLKPEKIELELQEVTINNLDLKQEIRTKEGFYYKVLSEIPEKIEISGLNEKVSKAQFAKVTLDLMKENAGIYKRNVKIDVFDFDYKLVEDIRIKPSELWIEVEVVRWPSQSREVVADTIGNPKEGYYVDEIIINPDKVVIEANPEIIDTIESIRTRPVDISGIENSIERTVRLEEIPGVKVISNEKVRITVKLKKGEKR